MLTSNILGETNRIGQDTNRSINLDEDGLHTLGHLIERFGFFSSVYENPSLLYVATRFRSSRDPLDRIYGIMQVFGFRLGEAAEPHRTFTLSQIENLDGETLISLSTVRAQLFVHTRPIEPGNCWRVDHYSQIPNKMIFA